MTYIKLSEGMDLTVTKIDAIYRGDNMSKAVTFLVPTKIGDIDTIRSDVFLTYIRPDGTPDIVILTPESTMYNPNYYQYTMPVTCKFSKCPGVICMWLQLMMGDPCRPTVLKSGECYIRVLDSKNIDDCLGDHQLTALYQMSKRVEDESDYWHGMAETTGENPDGEYWEDM